MVEVQSPNHWTTREVPVSYVVFFVLFCFFLNFTLILQFRVQSLQTLETIIEQDLVKPVDPFILLRSIGKRTEVQCFRKLRLKEHRSEVQSIVSSAALFNNTINNDSTSQSL